MLSKSILVPFIDRFIYLFKQFWATAAARSMDVSSVKDRETAKMQESQRDAPLYQKRSPEESQRKERGDY